MRWSRSSTTDRNGTGTTSSARYHPISSCLIGWMDSISFFVRVLGLIFYLDFSHLDEFGFGGVLVGFGACLGFLCLISCGLEAVCLFRVCIFNIKGKLLILWGVFCVNKNYLVKISVLGCNFIVMIFLIFFNYEINNFMVQYCDVNNYSNSFREDILRI